MRACVPMNGRAALAKGVIAGAWSALVVAGCSTPAPVPSGYRFPTHSTGGGGAAALLEGDLVVAGGCLYVQPDRGPRYLVVWPDTLRLALEGDTPVVMEGTEEVVRDGGRVRLGGGEAGPNLAATTAGGCDTANLWSVSEVVPAASAP